MHESEKWKWSRSVMSDSPRTHGLQPTRLLRPWDFPGKSTGVGVSLSYPWLSYLSSRLLPSSLFLISCVPNISSLSCYHRVSLSNLNLTVSLLCLKSFNGFSFFRLKNKILHISTWLLIFQVKKQNTSHFKLHPFSSNFHLLFQHHFLPLKS